MYCIYITLVAVVAVWNSNARRKSLSEFSPAMPCMLKCTYIVRMACEQTRILFRIWALVHVYWVLYIVSLRVSRIERMDIFIPSYAWHIAEKVIGVGDMIYSSSLSHPQSFAYEFKFHSKSQYNPSGKYCFPCQLGFLVITHSLWRWKTKFQ